MSKWVQGMPIWVSRKTVDGYTSQYSVPLWMFMFIGVLALLNVLLWSGIGLYEAVKFCVG